MAAFPIQPILPRRKCFVSYHHDDQDEILAFVNRFDDAQGVFIRRLLGESPDDLINSTDTDYVMGQIRSRYLKDSTVTIVMMGRCTWARRYVDWEIQASLRQGATLPNGLLGIKLPSFTAFPERFRLNLSNNWPLIDCYARHIDYPVFASDLQAEIERAFQRRTTHASLIRNPREFMRYNRTC
jgi:hypothetical protein